MSVLEFIASMADAMAWPVAALVVAFWFRSSIVSALDGQIRRWKVGPVEAEFWERKVAVVRGQLPHDAEAQAERVPGGGLVSDLSETAEAAPSGAVMEAFIRIERELRRIPTANDMDDSIPPRLSGGQLARVLHSRGQISDQVQAAIEGLTTMRNLAAHDRADVDTKRALEFVHIADAVLYALRETNPGELGENHG